MPVRLSSSRAILPSPVPSLPAALAVVLVALLASPVAGTAHAQTISACYVPQSGTAYIIKQPGAPEACRTAQHVEISWQVAGVPGPQGPQGPQGVPGPAGPQGPAGAGALSGLEIRSQFVQSLPPIVSTANYGVFRTSCPTGKSTIALGWEPRAGGTAPSVVHSIRPAINGGQVEWTLSSNPGSAWTFWWTCANAEPATVVSLPPL